jgi:hypothetical protein
MNSVSTDYNITTSVADIITITGGSDSYTIGDITIPDINNEFSITWGTEEWVDGFPEWEKIQLMCNEYPGLKIAFEKFKTTYKLVRDDYDTPKDQRKTI